jgi:hypothetical protein
MRMLLVVQQADSHGAQSQRIGMPAHSIAGKRAAHFSKVRDHLVFDSASIKCENESCATRRRKSSSSS